MINPKSKENLKPFKKGADPRRHVKGKTALPGLKELLEELGEKEMKEIITALYKQAKKGNVRAIQEVLDRYYGKSQQSVDVTTKGESLNDLSNLSTDELIKRAKATKDLGNADS